MYISTDLTYDQKRELLADAKDAYAYMDSDTPHPEDTAFEVVDGWVPFGNNRIVSEWTAAGYPEAEDYDMEAEGTIVKRMAQGLYAIALQYLHAVIGDATTAGEALEAITVQEDVIVNPAKYWREIVDA